MCFCFVAVGFGHVWLFDSLEDKVHYKSCLGNYMISSLNVAAKGLYVKVDYNATVYRWRWDLELSMEWFPL